MRKIFCIILILGIFQACGFDQKIPAGHVENDLAKDVKKEKDALRIIMAGVTNVSDPLLSLMELTPPGKTVQLHQLPGNLSAGISLEYNV